MIKSFLNIKFNGAKEDDILKFLENENENELVRHISIKFIKTAAIDINKALDSFILTRPWWIIKVWYVEISNCVDIQIFHRLCSFIS